MKIITSVQELESRKIDGLLHTICKVSMNGNLAFVLRAKTGSITTYSYSKDFEFDYEEGKEKDLSEYNWNMVEQEF